MTQCPVCDGTEFVAKKLVYEEMGYTEDGDREYHQARVRAEFELTCRTCGQRYHELTGTLSDVLLRGGRAEQGPQRRL